MYLTVFEDGVQLGQKIEEVDVVSMYAAFEQVKDGRMDRGKRYPLALVLTLLMLGTLAGEQSVNGIIDWVRERKYWLKKQLDWPRGFPVHSTYTQALAHCDTAEVSQAIMQIIHKARESQ
ncbi:MAG TPA: transposase family protein [Ktedonobacteraceae bacterium]|jgi:hypothetical protein